LWHVSLLAGACSRDAEMTTSPAVRMTVRWKVAAGEAWRITEALHELMIAARREPGYVNCSLSTELIDGATLSYGEQWESEEHLRRQIRSTRFARLANLVELASERPVVEFRVAGGTRGLDYAQELSGGSGNEHG
jgi:quinol monooxygenase YgiN